MAEVAAAAAAPAADLQVLSVRRFEVQPPENLQQDLATPEGTYATTKEEEWVTKKKTELTTTRQIETRVQRQVVLEDGKVVEDSGPVVTSNTTEDTEKQESQQTEHRTTGEAPPAAEEGWVAVANPEGTVREVHQKTVRSREQTDERLETEQVRHCGDISDDAYQAAVRASPEDLRAALRPEEAALTPLASEPRVVHQSAHSSKVVDTEDRVERSAVQPDGRLVTETRRTTEHEEVRDHSEPDDEDDGGDAATTRAVTGDEERTLREASHRFARTNDQELVEYLADGVKVGEEMRYQAEATEAERRGDAGLAEQEWDSLSTRIRRMRRAATKGGRPPPHEPTPLDRKDALTRKPLDFEQEEETRKVETSKWLEHHFGSDSRSSKGSLDDEAEAPAAGAPATSFINVTMKSRPPPPPPPPPPRPSPATRPRRASSCRPRSPTTPRRRRRPRRSPPPPPRASSRGCLSGRSATTPP